MKNDIINPEEAIKILRKWGKVKINGKSLRDSLVYDNIPLWDIIEYNFASLLFEQEETIFGKEKKKDLKERAEPFLRKYLNTFKERQRKKYYPQKTIKKRKKIVFIVPIETAVPVISPVIKKLEEDGEYDLKVIRFSSLRERVEKCLKNEGIPSVPVERYSSEESDRRMKEFRNDLKRIWNQMNDGNFAKRVSYRNLNVWNSVKFSFSYYFHSMEWILELVKYIGYLKNIISREEPSIIVMADESSEFAKATGIISDRYGIPSLGVQHGFFGESNLIYGPSYYDKIAVWGEYTKNIMSERGIEKKKIVVTGCPKFDSLMRYASKDSGKICNKYGFDKNKDILLYIGRGILKKEDKGMLMSLFKLAAKIDNAFLVVKMHPRIYDKGFYSGLANNSEAKNVLIKRKIDLYDLLRIANCVIMESSTVGIEALMFNKPVIMVGFRKDSLFKKDSSFLFAENKNELKTILMNKKYKKRNLREKAVKYCYKLDGKSTDRIINLIKSTAKK